MDKILYWNNRGSCDSGLHRNLKTIINGSNPSLVILADTRCFDKARLRHLLRLGYDEIKMLPGVGLSGGMAAIWKSHAISISIVEEDRQYLYLRCSVPSSQDFFLTPIYALPHLNLRSSLWHKLHILASGISIPWLVFGDFNDIASLLERIGGVRPNISRMSWFQSKIHNCGLNDLGLLAISG
ncbi:hypothetical protein K1719_037549 [Acacia pycnantha]|nr:hypothetical protein K1719_037549 [Acacia pycnantha]